MRVYLEAMRLAYRRYRTYGAATLAGLATNAFFGVLRSYVFIALYHNRGVTQGFSLHDAVSYVWLSQAMIMPLYLWSWFEIADTIRSGDVITDLSKPFDYFGYWLSRDLGRAAYHLLYRWLPTVLMGAILFGLRVPHNPLTVLWFALSLLMAVVLSFCVRFAINISGFWSTDVRGLYGICFLFVNFFSGFLVPLAFFPPTLRALSQSLPFAGMISIPLTIFLEQAHGIELAWLLLEQALWLAAFVVGARLLLRAAVRKLVVQGG